MMRRPAFTLLEVMLSLVIMLVLGVGMLTFLHDLRVRHQRVSEVSSAQRAAAALIDGLERDLATCTVSAGDAAGLRGTATSIEVHSRGVMLSLTADARTHDDRLATTYAFADAPRRLSVSRRAETDSPASPEAIATEVIARVRFRYHDGQQWSGSFDSAAANTLPAAVEVAVWFTAPPALEEAESTGAATRLALADEADAPLLDPFADEAPDAFAFDDGIEADWGQPDRVRVIAVPRLTRERSGGAG
ncbi:MAG: hypothetical protein KDA21_06270 [Phycisphaerales bacterium]|nr:hypothetical protein [Phycisphaerales bacterium]